MISESSASRIFRSPCMQRVLVAVQEAISTPGGILIFGEAGSGRETLARAIHKAATGLGDRPLEEALFNRPRPNDPFAPFVALNCAVVPDLETLLFGAAATATQSNGLECLSPQAFALRARGGTLFIRSVQDMPRRVQGRLARVLRDGEIWLTDGDRSQAVALELRVIASMDSTAGADLEPLVPELQKRLAVHRIDLPPLRHRREDLPGLVRALLIDICRSRRVPVKLASRQALSLLSALPWRGNLTELRAMLQVLIAAVPGRKIRLADVLANVQLDARDVTCAAGGTLREARERFEREYVAAVLQQHQGCMTDAAKALGVQRANLYRKVRQLAVPRHPRTVPLHSAIDSAASEAAVAVRSSAPRSNEEDALESV